MRTAVDWIIRSARPEDAEGISLIVLSALRETNSRDYSEAIIARIEQNFSPAAVLGLIERRLTFVAAAGERIVGTASLDGDIVRTVFIAPECQGHGIGRALMTHVEKVALAKGVEMLVVSSSVTAEPFYARLGFRVVRDSYYGEERTIVMERPLSDR